MPNALRRWYATLWRKRAPGLPILSALRFARAPVVLRGLRVALAFAKGLSLPRKIPLIGISALEVHAARLDSAHEKSAFVYTDVRRGELCFQGFSKGRAVTPVMTKQAEAAMTYMREHGGDVAEFSGSISVPIMAWLSMELSPESHPALPLYSRAPDAKLPGGVTP